LVSTMQEVCVPKPRSTTQRDGQTQVPPTGSGSRMTQGIDTRVVRWSPGGAGIPFSRQASCWRAISAVNHGQQPDVVDHRVPHRRRAVSRNGVTGSCGRFLAGTLYRGSLAAGRRHSRTTQTADRSVFNRVALFLAAPLTRGRSTCTRRQVVQVRLREPLCYD
jgi:hypothetical protein